MKSLRMSHFGLRRFKAIPDLAFENLFILDRSSTISFSPLTWSSIHLLFSPVLKIKRKQAWNGSFDSKGKLLMVSGCDVEVPFESSIRSLKFSGCEHYIRIKTLHRLNARLQFLIQLQENNKRLFRFNICYEIFFFNFKMALEQFFCHFLHGYVGYLSMVYFGVNLISKSLRKKATTWNATFLPIWIIWNSTSVLQDPNSVFFSISKMVFSVDLD